jgi:hypothetical protein
MMKTSVSTAGGQTAVAGIGDRIVPRKELPDRFRETHHGWLVMALVWVASGSYLALHLREGWVPYDGGALAQMAERTLRGQVPYRDFIELYTGGLTYLDALAFRLFGVDFFSLRIPVLLFSLGWVPALYLIARRFVRPLTAGALTLLSVVWSVPNYPEAQADWYNLFFATWGVLALIRFTETERRRWLWIAGLCAGLSFLAKITALYFVAAGLLFFVFREVKLYRGSEAAPGSRALAYRVFASVGLLLFLAVLAHLILQSPTGANLFYFVLPSTCLVSLLLCGLWRTPSAQIRLRFRRLFSMVLPFLSGAITPVAAFLVYLASVGALRAWAAGILGAGFRTQWLLLGPPSPLIALGLVPAGLVLALAYHGSSSVRRCTGIAAPVVLAAMLWLASRSVNVYSAVSEALPALVPALAVATLLSFLRTPAVDERRQQFAFLLVSCAVVCSLVQFPFAFPIYFSYDAPLVLLAIVAVLSTFGGNADRVAVASLISFYLVFAICLRTPGFTTTNGFVPDSRYSLSRLDGPRGGGLLVNAAEAKEYRRLIPLVRAHARGSYIYAGPDAPEIYFLTGLRNPTKTLFDLLDPDFLDVPERDDRILSTINRHDVTVVVLRVGEKPENAHSGASQTAGRHGGMCEKNPSVQSGPPSKGLLAALDSEFPESERVCDFDVRWK